MDVGHKGNAGAITYKPSLVTIQMLPASECPENNQSALFKLGNFLVLNSYVVI